MPDHLAPDADNPLDRTVHGVLAWEHVPHAPARTDVSDHPIDQHIIERAKGAVMLRYGVNSHVALAMLARWSRSADVSITTLARALVDGAVRNGQLPDDHHQIGRWLQARDMETD